MGRVPDLAFRPPNAYRVEMRVLACLLPLLVVVSASSGPPPDTFVTRVEPILKGKCVPCHFAGGKVYDKLPFDRPATIVSLGERLFTRIKDEQQRAIIRAFLAEQKSKK